MRTSTTSLSLIALAVGIAISAPAQAQQKAPTPQRSAASLECSRQADEKNSMARRARISVPSALKQ